MSIENVMSYYQQMFDESKKIKNFNSFLPTVRSQQFSDSFRGFTFLVGKKIEVKPTKISKLNTFFQFCLVITTMLSNINGYEKYFTALMLNEALITVVLVCTLISLMNYISYWFKNIN